MVVWSRFSKAVPGSGDSWNSPGGWLEGRVLVIPKIIEEVFLGRWRRVAIAPNLSGVVVFEFGGEGLEKDEDLVGGLIGEWFGEGRWTIHCGTPMSER
jgi:hypothetical protein